MSSRTPAAVTLIVRVLNEAQALEQALLSVRRQTVPTELLVVDSGSTDGSLDIARRLADQVIEIDPARFTYGYALNVGAAAASTPIHGALSAHCVLPRDDWVATALSHYARDDVAATIGETWLPTGKPVGDVFFQDIAFFRSHPHWGFSNHASTWRASVWREFPFDETLPYAEDKEWALRVLRTGMTMACDPALKVDSSHQYEQGMREWYRRSRLCGLAYGEFWPEDADDLRSVLSEWWRPGGQRPRSLGVWRERTDVSRVVCLAGRWAGHREARRRTDDGAASPIATDERPS